MGNFGTTSRVFQVRLATQDGIPVVVGHFQGTFSNSYATGGDTFSVATWFAPGSILDAGVHRQTSAITTAYTYGINRQAVPNDLSLLVMAFNPTRAHNHVLRFQTNVAANAVTAQANQLRTAAAAFDVAGVADNTGEGGVVSSAATSATEVANTTNLSTVVIVIEVWARGS